MANPAQEARERLEARFRGQYEADRIAEKQRAERDIQASRNRDTEPTTGGTAERKGGRQSG
jgi:hypothetical protein